MQLLRTEPGAAYNEMLNRIQFFISADQGLDEYMGKNFEAMAAGCVLCCFRQGGGEEEALGFVDLENVVLYSDLEELKKKLDLLKEQPDKIKEIARSGRELAIREYSLACLAQKTASALVAPIDSRREPSLTQKLLAGIGF